MNYVALKLTNKVVTCSINNEKLNDYSDITSLLNADISKFVNNILKELDEELDDDYTISFQGPIFIYNLICNNKNTSKYCKSISFEDDDQICLERKYLALIKLVEKYAKNENYAVQRVVNNELNVSLPDGYLNSVESDIIITTNLNKNYKYNIFIGDTYAIEQVEEVYIITIPLNMINVFFQYYELLEKENNVDEMILTLKGCELEDKDKKEFTFLTTEEPQFYLSNLNDNIEYGVKYKYGFYSFPESYYQLSFSQGLVFLNDTYEGLIEGEHTINVIGNGAIVYSKRVTCTKHNYLTEIRILSDLTDLLKNEKSKIDVLYIPNNADDIEDVKYEIVDSRIAMITDHKEIVPLQTGSTILKIKGKNVSAETNVIVRLNVGHFEFEEQAYTLVPGETKIIPLRVIGDNVKTEQLQWYFDNPNIAYMRPSVKHDCCQIVASTQLEGRGNIRCYNPITQTNKYCTITVAKPPKSNVATLTVIVIMIILCLLCCAGIGS